MVAMARDAALARYLGLVEEALRASVPRVFATCESPGTLRVERGVAYPLLMLREFGHPGWTGGEIEELVRVSPGQLATGVRIEDLEGHRRPVYEGLLFYSAFRALRLPAAWQADDAEDWAAALEARLARTSWPDQVSGVPRAADGARWVEAIWLALASHAAGDALRATGGEAAAARDVPRGGGRG
jgi:hypothetical protein